MNNYVSIPSCLEKHVFIVGWSVWKGPRKGEGMGKYVYTHREPAKLIPKYYKYIRINL